MSVLKTLENYGIIPALRLKFSDEQAVAVAEAIRKGGVKVLELSCANEGSFANVAAVHAACGDMVLGMGDVATAAQAERAVKSGAQFVTASALCKEVVDYCAKEGICLIPGCSTPAEVEQARAMGVSAVKYFPIQGLEALADLTAAYPDMKFVVQGSVINEETLEPYLHVPGVMAVSGGWLVKEKQVAAGDFDAVTACTRASVRAIFQYVFEHVGINYYDVPSMEPTVFKLAQMFNLKLGDTGSSTFVSEYMELTKEKYRGEHGHIGFRTNDIVRSVFYFENDGIEFDKDSIRLYKGSMHVIYFKEQWGGFAWHLQTNNDHNPPRWEDAEVVLARGGLSNKYIGKK